MRWLPRLLLAFAAVLSCMPAGGARAGEDTGWTIDSFVADIRVHRDGSLRITETIAVDFADLERHGIFRDIPVRYEYDGDHDRLYQLAVVSITDADGDDWPYTRTQVGSFVRLRIGDPDRTISGQQTYVITYDIQGALNAFDTHDELFWNVNGLAWPVPTDGVSAVVSVKGGGITRTACYRGAEGSDTPCTHVENEAGDSALFSSDGGLPAKQGMTIVVGIEKGVISPAPAPILVADDGPDTPREWFDRYVKLNPGLIIGSVALFVAGAWALIVAWWRHGRDRVYRSIYYLTQNPDEHTRPLFYKDEVVVEYTPPDDLRPAQLGLILDERADTKDVTATIVDLAVRGYLSIEEKEKTWIFGSKDWRLTKKKEADDALLPFERRVLAGLFADGATEVDLSDLKNEFYDDLAEAQKRLYEDAMNRKWFARRPDTWRDWVKIAAVGIIAAGAALGWLLGRAYGAAILGLPIVVLGLLLFLLGALMTKRTAAGSEMLRRALGFRLFIETAEKRRQEFNERANIFAEYLPYAIVFGSVEKWASVFRDIDTAPATQSWYTGSGSGMAFSAPDFSRSLSSFSSSLSSVIVSTPGGSGGSGFGGGGGSGGGGGGGGGGSW